MPLDGTPELHHYLPHSYGPLLDAASVCLAFVIVATLFVMLLIRGLQKLLAPGTRIEIVQCK